MTSSHLSCFTTTLPAQHQYSQCLQKSVAVTGAHWDTMLFLSIGGWLVLPSGKAFGSDINPGFFPEIQQTNTFLFLSENLTLLGWISKQPRTEGFYFSSAKNDSKKQGSRF